MQRINNIRTLYIVQSSEILFVTGFNSSDSSCRSNIFDLKRDEQPNKVN